MTDSRDPADAPAMTIRDMVKELREDMKFVRDNVTILCAANLPNRVDALESRRDISIGRSGAIALLVSGVVSLAGVAAAAFGLIR